MKPDELKAAIERLRTNTQPLAWINNQLADIVSAFTCRDAITRERLEVMDVFTSGIICAEYDGLDEVWKFWIGNDTCNPQPTTIGDVAYLLWRLGRTEGE